MEIIHRKGLAFKVIQELVPPYERPRLNMSKFINDVLCEDLNTLYSEPNTRNIVLVTDNPTKPIMSYQDLLNELDYIKRAKFRNERLRCELISYYEGVSHIIKSYIREDQINKVLNNNECTLYLAC